MPFLQVRDIGAAQAVRRAGSLFAVFSILRSVVRGCVHGDDLTADLIGVSVYGLVAVALLAIIGRLADGFLLGKLASAIDGGNMAAAVASAGHRVAAGNLIAHCIYGDDLATLVPSFVLLVVAVLTMTILLTLFRTLTVYDDGKQIGAGNPAAALSYAGVAIAMALFIGHAADSSFGDVGVSLQSYVIALTFCLLLYPVRQIVVGRLLLGLPVRLRGGAFDVLIARDHSVGAAAAEAAAYVATAILVTGLT